MATTTLRRISLLEAQKRDKSLRMRTHLGSWACISLKCKADTASFSFSSTNLSYSPVDFFENGHLAMGFLDQNPEKGWEQLQYIDT